MRVGNQEFSGRAKAREEVSAKSCSQNCLLLSFPRSGGVKFQVVSAPPMSPAFRARNNSRRAPSVDGWGRERPNQFVVVLCEWWWWWVSQRREDRVRLLEVGVTWWWNAVADDLGNEIDGSSVGVVERTSSTAPALEVEEQTFFTQLIPLPKNCPQTRHSLLIAGYLAHFIPNSRPPRSHLP